MAEKTSRNTQASLLTLAILVAAPIACDMGNFLRNGSTFPVATFFFTLLFVPILCLLWRKENIRDLGAKALLRYCWAGLVLAGAIGARAALHFWFSERPAELDEFMHSATGGILSLVLVVSGLFVFFVALSFLRLAVKAGLNKILGDGGLGGELKEEALAEPPEQKCGPARSDEIDRDEAS